MKKLFFIAAMLMGVLTFASTTNTTTNVKTDKVYEQVGKVVNNIQINSVEELNEFLTNPQLPEKDKSDCIVTVTVTLHIGNPLLADGTMTIQAQMPCDEFLAKAKKLMKDISELTAE